MEKTQTQHMILIVFGGALLAAIVVALVIYFLPGVNDETALVPLESASVVPGGEQVVTTTFNTSVLDNPAYQELDSSLFIRGLLPVVPPTGTGKTNLFQ